jgi:hypothetical protein
MSSFSLGVGRCGTCPLVDEARIRSKANIAYVVFDFIVLTLG